MDSTVKFLLYPNLPVIRKSLTMKNLGSEDVSLESVDIEKFGTTGYFPSTFSWIYTNYGRRVSIGPYKGNMQDALVVVHNMNWESGIVIGNEATGILKHTSAFWDADEISSGLTHKDRNEIRRDHRCFPTWSNRKQAPCNSEVSGSGCDFNSLPLFAKYLFYTEVGFCLQFE